MKRKKKLAISWVRHSINSHSISTNKSEAEEMTLVHWTDDPKQKMKDVEDPYLYFINDIGIYDTDSKRIDPTQYSKRLVKDVWISADVTLTWFAIFLTSIIDSDTIYDSFRRTNASHKFLMARRIQVLGMEAD